ncbi:Mus7/MMS22 family-domain-containing protein [Boeremia exigua]|uniref:Mus7/MMS22 family-domain-containing protein n=1 Tax=Boeremia exigua TaxID=749465 RepID=UPI001E8DCF7D|nr:Mus7/MMS22 family-domain-containing protein [Boeremia exigua]KAH6618863.1 Mus7/MMS22 family-domain-containing protein [Boeremia exigua]
MQAEEFDPFENGPSSSLDPEIFVSTPIAQQTGNDQRNSSIRRPRPTQVQRGSPAIQLRVPKPAKKRRLNGSLSQALATPTRASERSIAPVDIWSIPPNSPPYSSSPPLNALLDKLISTRNVDNLPTPSNSSTFHDEPPPLPDSDSDAVPRSAQRSGGGLRRPIRVILSDEPSSDSDAASSASEQADGELQKVGKKIKGVLPASWLRIDRQAQERRQSLARQRVRQSATHSPEPTEPQRGVAKRVVKPSRRPSGLARTFPSPDDVVVISDESDQEPEATVHRPANNAQDLTEDATSLAAMFDDRYAEAFDDLASMEHDRLPLPTLGGSAAKRKRQPKITDVLGNAKRSKTSRSTVLPKSIRPSKLTSGSSTRKKQVGPRRARTPLPALSIVDVELPRDVPQFLKLAMRAARRDVDQARQSPHRKHILLHTAQDTRDATATLQQWQQGLLQPAVTPNTNQRCGNRLPLADTTENRQRGSRSNNPSKDSGANATIDLVSSTSKSRPHVRKTVASALQVLQRSSNVASKPRRLEHVAKPHKRSEEVVRHGGAPLRTAQLEGDERNFGRSHRKIAFQKGLHRVNLQSGIHQDPKQRFLNPQLARFLADDDAVLPPLPTAAEAGEYRSDSPTGVNTAITVPPMRLKQKLQATRIDIDAREYRQPSEPEFEPTSVVPTVVLSESAPTERSGDQLLGLGLFGTRYPITFDIAPLKSDTYFHSDTFVGSEDLRRALSIIDTRDMDDPTGYCVVSHGPTTIRCGPWSDETYSQLSELLTTILPALVDGGDKVLSGASAIDALTSITIVLRALAAYISGHLSFSDPIDRKDFAIKMQYLLQATFNRLSIIHTSERETQALPEQTEIICRVLSYLLVIGTQVHHIAKHVVVPDLDKARLLDTIRDISRLLVKGMTMRTKRLFDFHEKNRLHRERENGIQGQDILVESIVISMHALELLNTPSLGFWDLVSHELSSELSSAYQVQAFDNVWATLMSLLPFIEFDLSGIPDRSRLRAFDKDNWGCVCILLKRILALYSSTSSHGTSLNEYIRANLTRCYVLINDWHWKRPEQILNVIFDFFGKHGLKSLRREPVTGSAAFLRNFVAAGSMTLASNETSFHIALKCLATGLQGMANAYPEKKLLSFVFRRIPNHGRTYPKDQPLDEESLTALRNHHDLLSTLYCAVPPSCRPRLDLCRDLVSHETSHREACRVSVRAWANLTTFQLSTDETYAVAKPFALWYKDIMHQTLKQYRLAKTEAEEYLKSAVLDDKSGVVAKMVKQTMEKNQEQVIATLRDSIAGMKHAVQCATDSSSLASFLADSDMIQLLELPHLEDLRLLNVIRDTLSVLRQYALMQRAQVRQPESQPRSEESQDYGDFPDLDDLDDVDELQTIQTASVAQSSCLDFVQGPLWHLISNAFGAERSPDDNLLLDCIDVWVLIAGDQVSGGGKDWSAYIASFSQVSWQQLRPTEQTRKFGPYFMAALIARDPAVYHEHRQEFLTALLLCLADRESMLRFQHRLLSAIVTADGGHPLLKNLPFFKTEETGLWDITADTLRLRRLALISSLLSNMREHVYTTTVREPAYASQLKTQYAAMLQEFMTRLRSNYQQLQQGGEVAGAYVDFVQKIVRFLKQYTSDICPVLNFFTDSVAFPLPSTDPSYVVGRLCGYAPKAQDLGTAKQLSCFIQTVAQQAAADNQQVYLRSQLTTALCTDEAPITDRVALRTVLLQGIFPAYIEGAFASRVGHLIARPILQCLPTVLDESIYDLRVHQIESLSMTIGNIRSIAHAFIRGTEHLKGDASLLQQPSILNGLVYMFETAMSIVRLLDYMMDRTVRTAEYKRPPLITYLCDLSVYIAQMVTGTIPLVVPSFRGDADAALSSAQYSDVLSFCTRDLQSKMGSVWGDDQDSIWFGHGRARKEIVCDVESAENGKARLLNTLQRFQETLGDGPVGLSIEDDMIV